MTIRITKARLAAAVAAVIVAIPAVAGATHIFSDVDDGAFYADAVEWAADEGITLGTGPTTFSPNQSVDRGQMVTFLKRMNDNVVAPATIGLFASDTNSDEITASGDLGLSASVTIPEGHTGVIEVSFAAESACYGGVGNNYCRVDLLLDGTAIGLDTNAAFDSSDGLSETSNSWESHAIIRVTDALAAGTYEITAESIETLGDPTLALDVMVLTAKVHLTS